MTLGHFKTGRSIGDPVKGANHFKGEYLDRFVGGKAPGTTLVTSTTKGFDGAKVGLTIGTIDLVGNDSATANLVFLKRQGILIEMKFCRKASSA